MPTMQASLKERRADEKEDLNQQYAYQLAQAGVKGKAYEFSINQFDKLKDNRLREKTLDEAIRHNEAQEKLTQKQINASGVTGGERMMREYIAGDPTKRAAMEKFFQAQSAYGGEKLNLAQEAEKTRAYDAIDKKYKDQLFMLSQSKKKAPELAALNQRIAQEKRAVDTRVGGNQTYTFNPETGKIE
jgi:hypothetical protein